MKRFFHSELEEFRSNLILMAEKAIEVVRDAVNAVLENDPDLAKRVIKKDDAIDDLEKEIDAEAIRYLSLRAPVATELRLLTLGMNIATDLERIGDEATSIAKRTSKLGGEFPVKDFLHLPAMAEHTLEMLRDAIDSFLDGNEEKAMAIIKRDKKVDELNRENFDKLKKRMADLPETVSSNFELIFVSKSLERIADHATNVAEEVIYLLKAEDIRHSPEIKDYKRVT